MTSFGMVSADAVKVRMEMRSAWIRVGPEYNESVRIRDRKGHRDTEKAAV